MLWLPQLKAGEPSGNRRIPGLPIKKAFRIMSSSEELSQRLEKRFHCACDFHASFNFSDFQLSEKYSRKFVRFFVRMLAVLALRWSKASKLCWFYRPREKGESAAFVVDLWSQLDTWINLWSRLDRDSCICSKHKAEGLFDRCPVRCLGSRSRI
jgi:hypothetical protein